MYEAVREHQSINIRQISRSRAEQVGYYRFLENPKVTACELVSSLSDACAEQVEGLHVLALNDTSEINLQAHAGRLNPEGLGVVGNNRDLGFFLHPTLAVNAATGFPLGLSYLHLWSRAVGHANKHERDYEHLAIEHKESYKWLKSAVGSQRCFQGGGARMVTYVSDREGDFYEAWARIPDAQTHLLARVQKDHQLYGQSVWLYEYLTQQPSAGTYTFAVLADPRHKRIAREAWMMVRFAKVELRRPDALARFGYAPSVTLWAVETVEISPPAGQKPVHWRLLTTHEVNSLEQALQIIEWYRVRWRIEQLFATLKTAGLDLESTQLESVEAIQRLCIVATSVALYLLQMVEARDDAEIPASVTFSAAQQQCLHMLLPTLNGRTLKQQNPYPQSSLAWATWIIARLGGWSGYASQRPPGIATLAQGWRTFDSIFLGWNLAHSPPLVCTQ